VASIVTPPYRTALVNGDGTDKTWWLFWKTLGDLANAGMKMLTFGVHTDRPVAGDVPDGAIYVEDNRGGVIYQSQGGEWHYLAGTMWGTVSPDQRPADLGVNDTGFDFRTTVTPSQEFMWSGNSWIEITPLRYGTHAQRLATPVTPSAGLWSGAAWVETDRGNVIYQNQAGTWHYLAGTMFGTLSPDQRPGDLGVNDAGFDFRTSVNPPREFMWSQSAWVEITPAQDNLALLSTATASLTLTTSAQAIPGTTLTLSRAGSYLVHGVFYFNFASPDAGNTLVGSFSGAGPAVAALNLTGAGIGIGATVAQQWLYTATAGATVFLQAYKSGGAGSSNTVATHTSISAIWLGP
jgi:hypothetical protein